MADNIGPEWHSIRIAHFSFLGPASGFFTPVAVQPVSHEISRHAEQPCRARDISAGLLQSQLHQPIDRIL